MKGQFLAILPTNAVGRFERTHLGVRKIAMFLQPWAKAKLYPKTNTNFLLFNHPPTHHQETFKALTGKLQSHFSVCSLTITQLDKI